MREREYNCEDLCGSHEIDSGGGQNIQMNIKKNVKIVKNLMNNALTCYVSRSYEFYCTGPDVGLLVKCWSLILYF